MPLSLFAAVYFAAMLLLMARQRDVAMRYA